MDEHPIDLAIPPASSSDPQEPLASHGLQGVTHIDFSDLNTCEGCYISENQMERTLRHCEKTLVSINHITSYDWDSIIRTKLTNAILELIFHCPCLKELTLKECYFDNNASLRLGDVTPLKSLTIIGCDNIEESTLFTRFNQCLVELECDSILITKNIKNLSKLQSLSIRNTDEYSSEMDSRMSRSREAAIVNLRFLPDGTEEIIFEIPYTLNVLLEFLKHVPDSVDRIEFYTEDIEDIIRVRDEDIVVPLKEVSRNKRSDLDVEVISCTFLTRIFHE